MPFLVPTPNYSFNMAMSSLKYYDTWYIIVPEEVTHCWHCHHQWKKHAVQSCALPCICIANCRASWFHLEDLHWNQVAPIHVTWCWADAHWKEITHTPIIWCWNDAHWNWIPTYFSQCWAGAWRLVSLCFRWACSRMAACGSVLSVLKHTAVRPPSPNMWTCTTIAAFRCTVCAVRPCLRTS